MSKEHTKEEIKEFVAGIMNELQLEGGTKKRLIRTLGDRCNYDKQKVLFKLKRALISERYQTSKE